MSFQGITLVKRRKPIVNEFTYKHVQVNWIAIKIKAPTWSSLRSCKCYRNDTEHICLQSWITQSLCQPRRTVCSVVAMGPMDMCTYNSWVALVPRLGSLSHREEAYIMMKTRVASKLLLLLLLLLLLVLMLLLLPLLCSHSLGIFVFVQGTVCQWLDS